MTMIEQDPFVSNGRTEYRAHAFQIRHGVRKNVVWTGCVTSWTIARVEREDVEGREILFQDLTTPVKKKRKKKKKEKG